MKKAVKRVGAATRDEAEDLILDLWVAGQSIDVIARELRERGLQFRGVRYPTTWRPFSEVEIRNTIAAARRRGDKRAAVRQ
jgi:hypothetical protein